MELESLYHGPTDSDADVRADSLANLACFASAAPGERVSEGSTRLELRIGLKFVTSVGEGGSDGVLATGLFEGLYNHISPEPLFQKSFKQEGGVYTVRSCVQQSLQGV